MTRYVLKGKKLSEVLEHHVEVEKKLINLKEKFPFMQYEVDLDYNTITNFKTWTITIEVNDGEQEVTEFRKRVEARKRSK